MAGGLPALFRYSDAVAEIGESALRSLLADGRVERIGHGLYRWSDAIVDEDLAEIAARAPRATWCLRTALARHNLIDDIPTVIDVAIPRGSWTPTTQAPVRWHHFAVATFDIGRDILEAPGTSIGIYSPERSIVDAFRLQHHEGPELARDALKTWLRRGGQPSALLTLAAAFPRTLTTIRTTLEILL